MTHVVIRTCVNSCNMGILATLGLGRNRYDATKLQPVNIVSPWSEPGNLQQISFAEIIGADILDAMPLSRERAITIPAVSRARNLLITVIARTPLVALDANGKLSEQPTFLYRTNGLVSPYERMAWTVDSLIFYGCALWLVERGTIGQILDAEWVPQHLWTITDGNILVDGKPVDSASVLLFNSPFEGLLTVANRTLRGAIDTEEAWVGRMRNPIPLIELQITDDTNLTMDEAKDFVEGWAKARRQPNGAVGLTPQGMQLNSHGEVDPALFLEGRNAIRTDVGSFLNVRASMIDGTSSIDSLTYVTKDGEKNAFFDLDLPFWTDPIQQALSQDNVVPRGQRVRFDFTEQYSTTPTPTGTPEQD